MAKGRDMVAESIDDVLELARSRRQSGLLSIEHIQGNRLEEGEIYFQSGQPIYARAGQVIGQDALSWLTRWHPIYFSFFTDVSLPPANIAAAQHAPPGFAMATPKFATAPSSSPRSDEPSGIHSRDYKQTSVINRAPVAVTSTAGKEWLTPRKNGNDREVLSMPLTRPQRFIYFLVDGHRTLADLARCTGKSIQEVERILSELQAQDLVAV